MRKSILLCLFCCLFAVSGCSRDRISLRYEVMTSGYVVYGWYLGRRKNVRVWVSDLRYRAEERGAFYVEVVVINDRSDKISFDLKQNRAQFGNREILVQDSFVRTIEPGETKAVQLRFPTFLEPAQMKDGVVVIEGIRLQDGTQLTYKVPVQVTATHEH